MVTPNETAGVPSSASAPSQRRKVVFVLGPPRSGTSAVSHMIERLGFEFGDHDRFVDPALHPHNPVFFELRSVNELNERICRTIGAGYAEFALLPTHDTYTEALHRRFRDDIAALLAQEFAGAATIGLKDPRFVVTLPLWQRAMVEQGYECLAVVTERDASAAAKSNSRVNSGFTEAHNRRIVELSKLMAAWQSRNLTSTLMDFDRLIAAPRVEAARLAAFLGRADGDIAAAAAVLDPSHLNHPVVAGDGAPSGSDILAERAAAYDALLIELAQVGVLDLLSALVLDRDRALKGFELAEAARHAAQEQSRSAHGLAAELASGFANLQALQPLPPVIRTPVSTLYLPDEQGELSEANSLLAEVESIQDKHRAVFRLPAGTLPRLLRFDPDVAPGIYRLEAVVIDGRELPDLDALVLQSSGAEAGHTLRYAVSVGNDPWWRLALADGVAPGLDHDAVVELRIDFRRMNAATLAADAAAARVLSRLRPVLAEGMADLVQRADTRSDTLEQAFRLVHAGMTGLSAKFHSLEASVQFVEAAMAASAARSDVLAAQLAGVREDADRRHERDGQAAERVLRDAAQANDESGRRIGALESAVTALGSDVSGTNARLAALEAHLEKMAGRLEEMAAAQKALMVLAERPAWKRWFGTRPSPQDAGK